ncbi:DUF3383 family protein [Candidatus Pacearchaeota archaeon]|nr:DUF3383 family protein [Candidatus Pacearchaeota archaeon]
MAERAIKRFVDVEIRKDTPRVSAAGFGILLVITDSSFLTATSRVRRFTTPESVSDFFGPTSEEAKAADAFFFQDPFLENQPEELQFGRFADADSAAVIECGDSPETDFEVWKLVSDGEFGVTIDAGLVDTAGLDFSSVTSLDDVAAVIAAGLGANGDCIFSGGRFSIISSTTGFTSAITLLQTVAAPAGTDISDALFLAGDVAVSAENPGGAIISQGKSPETVENAMLAIRNVNDDWYALGMIKKFRDTTDAEEFADEIESLRKMFLIATNDVNTLVLDNASNFSAIIKALNYKRTAAIYHDNSDLYPDMSWLGQELPKDIGSTNWAFKTLAGIPEGAAVSIPAVVLTQAQIDAAVDKNCNLYTAVLSANFTYFGTMLGGKNIDKDGEFIDIIRNIDFLQARTEEGLMSLLLEKDIIYFTNAGITIVDNRLKERLNTFGVVQGILVAGTVVTSFPKRSEVSRDDRDARLLPDGTFTAKLTGAIDTVVVRGTVFI